MKNLNVVAAWIAFTISQLTFSFTPPEVSNWRSALFPESKKSACIILSRGLDKPKTDPLGLWNFQTSLQNALVKQNAEALHKLLHPNLNVEAIKVRAMIKEIISTYGSSYSVTPYRLWAINHTDTKEPLIPCFDDQLALNAHYGYDLQFASWIQISGSKNIGRLYVSIVPSREGTWQIGAWHLQQWTYNGDDAEALVASAMKARQAGDDLAAYVLLDISSKLLDGGRYIFSATRESIIKSKDELSNPIMILEKFRKHSKDMKLVSTGTILSFDGPGLLFRFEVSEDEPIRKINQTCLREIARFYHSIDHTRLGGARCSLVVKGEDPQKEGVRGSILFTKQKILAEKLN